MIGHDAAGALRHEGAAFTHLIRSELISAREQQKLLLSQGRAGYATIFVLLLCITVNAVACVTIPDYFTLFIAASIYLQMFYFITLLIPMGGGNIGFPRDEILKVFSTLYHTGIISTTDRFTRIFMDAFFINSRSLAPGFLGVFSLSLLFTILSYQAGEFSDAATAIVLFQIAAIIVFYLLLMRLEPGTARFKSGVCGMKGMLAGKYPPWIIAVLSGTAALLILLLILTTIILLPGMTVKALMSIPGLEEATNLFILIGIIALSQYFIVRFFHGVSSTRMAAAFAESKIVMLQLAAGGQAAPGPGGNPCPNGPENTETVLETAAESLLASKIYRLTSRSIGGMFPVYLVDLDFSVLFDERVMAVIIGYLKGAGSAEPATG